MPGAEDDKEGGQGGGAADDKSKNPPNQDGKEGQGGADDKDKDKPAFKTMEEALAEITKLRKENASRRTTNKTLEERVGASETVLGKLKQALGIEKEESPEEVAANLKAQNEALLLEKGIYQLAIEQQIPADQVEYFDFLFRKKLSGLSEGEELGDDGLAEIVSKVKTAGGSKKSSTGVDGGNNPPPSKGDDGVTLEAFVKMNLGEKSALYQKNPTLYERFMSEAKQKRLLN
jgi:hypothetical protein